MTDNNLKDTQLKSLILNRLKEIIDEKTAIIKIEIELALETRDNETKSNVGDKYETTREMMQLEIEKNLVQLHKFEILKNELSKIDVYKTHNKVEYGSMVITSENKYFISIGLGKIEIENDAVYCISLNSPIGKILNNKKAGEKVNFQGKAITITNIF
jgi:transcription elongation GreA/GreB family factor